MGNMQLLMKYFQLRPVHCLNIISSISKYLPREQLRLWMLSLHVKLQLKNNQKARVEFFYSQSHVMHFPASTGIIST